MNRVYAIESAVTLTGGISDHRLAVRSGLIKAVAAYLDAVISGKANPLPELGAAQEVARSLGEPITLVSGVSSCCSLPSFITAMRSPIVIASTWSCVT